MFFSECANLYASSLLVLGIRVQITWNRCSKYVGIIKKKLLNNSSKKLGKIFVKTTCRTCKERNELIYYLRLLYASQKADHSYTNEIIAIIAELKNVQIVV